MENISQILPFKSILAQTWVSPDFQKKKKQKKKPEVKSDIHFFTLSQLVKDTHQELLEKNSLFRLCVYQKKDDIFMDVVTMDKSGKIDQLHNRSISNDDMGNLVRKIHRGMGLIFDYSL